MQPASQTCREVEDSRLVAWVHRTLRRKQNKLARENSGEERPSVSIKVSVLIQTANGGNFSLHLLLGNWLSSLGTILSREWAYALPLT